MTDNSSMDVAMPRPVQTGMQAREHYEFYVVMPKSDAVALTTRGRIRLGRYTSLRMDAPELNWDGQTEAIKREEAVSGVEQPSWPAAKVNADVVWLHLRHALTTSASLTRRLCRLRPPMSRALVRVKFSALGYAHFRHIGDLQQSWENWWRLYGDLSMICVDSADNCLYTAALLREF